MPKERLDRIDRALVAALQKNARISNKDLAERVGLAPSTCLERVRALRARGVLRGFHADVDRAPSDVGSRRSSPSGSAPTRGRTSTRSARRPSRCPR